jgi:signal transduction histidine kinase
MRCSPGSYGSKRPLPLEVEQTLFRITQEALANTARHSHACRTELSLAYEEDGFSLTVTDDGQGFHVDDVHAGLGLCSMKERTELIGGTLAIDGGPEQGTRIIVRGKDQPQLLGGWTDAKG